MNPQVTSVALKTLRWPGRYEGRGREKNEAAFQGYGLRLDRLRMRVSNYKTLSLFLSLFFRDRPRRVFIYLATVGSISKCAHCAWFSLR